MPEVKEYVLKVTPEELELLAAALNELPRKHVQALFEKLQGQVAEQNAPAAKQVSAESPLPAPQG